MDWSIIKEKVLNMIRKYRYAVVVILIGIVLMAIPGRTREKTSKMEPATQEVVQKTDEERLEELLSQIEGAGKVRVMLSTAAGEETLYQTNDNTSNSGDSASTRRDTVTVTDSDRMETGLVRQINPPKYLGAMVICEGADRASVRLAITDAVSKVTNLGYDCICVLRMK